MWRPRTPFEERMLELYRSFPPPPSHPAHRLLAARAQLEGERDVALRMWVKDVLERLPSLMLTRKEGGTGFPISTLLRAFFQEYASRIAQHGPYAFPTSF